MEVFLDKIESLVENTTAEQESASEFRGYEYDILAHRLYVESLSNTLTDSKIETLLSRWLLLNYIDVQGHQTPLWVIHSIYDMIAIFSGQMQSFLKQKNKAAIRVLDPILQKCSLKIAWIPDEEGFLQGTDHTRINYCADPIRGQIFLNGYPLQANVLPDRLRKEEQTLCSFGFKPDTLIRIHHDIWVTPDESGRIIYEQKHKKYIYQKKLTFSGTDEWYTYISAGFMPGQFDLDKQCWLAESQTGFYLLEKESMTPYAVGFLESDIKIIRVDKRGQWNHRSEHFLHLSPDSLLPLFLTKISPTYSIRAWGKKKNNQGYTLTSFEFADLNHLSFTVSEGKAYCDHFSKYFLSPLQSDKILGNLTGVLILEREGVERKRIAILPFKQQEGGFPLKLSKVTVNPGIVFQNNTQDKFYAYEIDEKSGFLWNTSKTAMLYLVFVLKLQGRYEEAALYLDRLAINQPFNDTDWEIIKAFLEVNNFTPAASALNLKLGVMIVENAELPLLNQTAPPLQQLLQQINKPHQVMIYSSTLDCTILNAIKALFQHYIHYLRVKGMREINPVPYDLRLTVKREKSLMKFLNQFKQACVLEDNPWFLNRKKQLFDLKGLTSSTHPLSIQEVKQEKLAYTSNGQFLDSFFVNYSSSCSRHNDAFQDLGAKLAGYQALQINPSLGKDEKCAFPRHNDHRLGAFAAIQYPTTPYLTNQLPFEIISMLSTALTPSQWIVQDGIDPFDLDMTILTYSFKVKWEKELECHREYVWKYHGLLSLLFLIRKHRDEFTHFLQRDAIRIPELTDTASRIIRRHYGTFWGLGSRLASFSSQATPSVLLSSTYKNNFRLHTLKPADTLNPIDLHQGAHSFFMPLGRIFDRFVTKSEQDVLNNKHKTFSLSGRTVDEVKSPLAKRFLVELTLAHKRHNKNKTYSHYSIKPNISHASLFEALTQYHSHALAVMEKLKNTIESLVNLEQEDFWKRLDPDVRMEALKHRNKINSGQIARLKLEPAIIQAVTARDAKMLKTHNPFLTQTEIEQMHSMAIQYMLMGSSADQCREALQYATNPAALLETARILGKERRYDPYQHPELLVYEYRSGMMLRTDPDQAELLTRIFTLLFEIPSSPRTQNQLHRLFFEFQAGGGKTKVLAAIILCRSIQEGKLAVFVGLPETYDITKEDLRQVMLSVFGIKTKCLDLALDTHTTEDELKKIYKMIKQCWMEHIALIMLPETYHSLHLDLQFSRIAGLPGRVKWLSLILALFKNRAVFQIDESHRTLDALFMANIATGTPFMLPQEQRDFLLLTYKLLAGEGTPPLTYFDGTPVGDALGLLENKQALKSAGEKSLVLNILADRFLQELKIPHKAHTEVKNYLTNRELPPPAWLTAWENSHTSSLKQQARLIFFARGLLLKVLPHALSLVATMDYGPSIHPGDHVEAPRHQKTETPSKFKDQDLAASLSNQALRRRGLTTATQIRTIIQSLQHDVYAEKMQSPAARLSPTEQLFLEWQKDHGAPLALSDLSPHQLNDDQMMATLVKRIGKQPQLIDRYLRDHVLPQILVYPHYYTSTAADLSNAASTSIHYSATLGAPEQYPFVELLEKFYWKNTAFLADVIQRGCMAYNSRTMWPEQKKPLDLFQDCLQFDKNLYNRLDGIINLGGWSKDFSNLEWAQQFLEFASSRKMNYAGVVFAYEEKVASDKTKNEKVLCILLRDDSKSLGIGELKRLQGSHLLHELERLGLKDKRFFKIYGANDATGMDLTLAHNAIMLVTLGERVTLSSLAQAIMRMRGFLRTPVDPETAQTMIWVGDPKLRENIAAQVNGNQPPDLFLWALYQEAERQRETILVRAFQEIDFAIRHIIEKMMQHPQQDPLHQIQLSKRHKNAYLYELGRDVYQQFGQETGKYNTRQVLKQHADNFAKYAAIDLSAYPETCEIIDKIIEQTISIMPAIDSCHRSSPSARMVQNTRTSIQQTQETKLNQITGSTSRAHPMPTLPYAANTLSLNSSGLLKDGSSYLQPVNKLADTDFYSSNLYVMQNVLNTIKKTNQRKPADRFMVVKDLSCPHRTTRAFMISLDDAVEYLRQLNENTVDAKQRQIALFTSNGKPEGRNMERADLENLTQGDWFKKILTDIALFNGKVRDLEQLKQLAQHHPMKLQRLWNEVQTARSIIDPNALDNSQINAFLHQDKKITVQREELRYFKKQYKHTLRILQTSSYSVDMQILFSAHWINA